MPGRVLSMEGLDLIFSNVVRKPVDSSLITPRDIPIFAKSVQSKNVQKTAKQPEAQGLECCLSGRRHVRDCSEHGSRSSNGEEEDYGF